MRLKFFCPALLCTGLLFLYACDFSGGLSDGGITVYLSGASGGGSGPARSVLPDTDTGGLVYKITFTGPGGTVIERTAEGGSINIALDAGDWSIAAEAYTPPGVIGGTLAGRGTATVTVVPGQYQSVTIPMYVDPAYEAGLTDIYIHNEAELRRIGADFAIDGSIRFYLERDIVLTQPWTPIGNDTVPFKAVFDGQGHSITINDFSAAALNGMYLGFFGKTYNGAAIENLTIAYNNLTASSTYTGSQWLGGLAASATGTLISGVHVKGTIQYTASNSLDIGGLVGGAGGNSGSSTDTQIYNSSFTGILRGTGVMTVSAGGILGALTGTLEDAKIETSYAAGIIHAASSASGAYAGGIAGDGACYIENCYSAAEVTASASSSAYAGGFIGQLPVFGSIRKCYALGTVSADGSTIYAGGIAGRSGSAIENCAALADIDGGTSADVGHVIGWYGGSPATNYAASDKAIARGTPGAMAIDGDTTYALSGFQGSGNQSKYETGLSWGFGADPWTWLSGCDYPALSWQTTPPLDPSTL
jgi:hypothetical protein